LNIRSVVATTRGVQKSGDARNNILEYMHPLLKSRIDECEKYRHLKYAKTRVDKKQVSRYLIKNISKSSVHFCLIGFGTSFGVSRVVCGLHFRLLSQ